MEHKSLKFDDEVYWISDIWIAASLLVHGVAYLGMRRKRGNSRSTGMVEWAFCLGPDLDEALNNYESHQDHAAVHSIRNAYRHLLSTIKDTPSRERKD